MGLITSPKGAKDKVKLARPSNKKSGVEGPQTSMIELDNSKLGSTQQQKIC